ncbi:hypothetical protein ABMC10_14945 [Anaerostipes caccae]
MAEKKYTENLGLTQQDEEDFVDGAEISRSFRVLDEKVWKNTVDMDNAKQELYKKIGNIETNDLFGYTPETITYGDKGYLAFGYKDGETQSFTYLTSTNAKEWQNVGYTDRIKHLEYLDSGTYIGATNANMIHYLYGESGEFTQFPTSQNWEVNKIKAFGSRALIIGSKIIRAYMDYALDLYTLGVLPDEPLIDIVKINDEDKFVGCTEHIVYEYQNLIGSGTETQELIFEKNDEVISSILFKDNRLYYTTQSGNIYRSEPEHYTLMVKVAEGFETGKNKLIHYSGMFLLQTEHNVYTSTDCKEWKTTLTTNKKFNNAKYVNDKFAICGDEGVKFLSIEKSLKEQVNELNSALNNIVTSPVIGEVTNYTTSEKEYINIAWSSYHFLLITWGSYGNVYQTILIPSTYIDSTNSGKRIIVGNDELQIYKKSENSLSARATTASQINRAIIYGIMPK